MKKIFPLLVVFLSILSLLNAAGTRHVGKIDLYLATSLHPKMALFDFDRMGFFKVPSGLDEEEFSAAVAKWHKTSETGQAAALKIQIEGEISTVSAGRAALVAELEAADQSEGIRLAREIELLAHQEDELRRKLYDASYSAECPDLTTPEETRRILGEIETEILAAVREVAQKLELEIVLNSSIPVSTGYPVRYMADPLFGQGVPGINFHLFYAFMAKPPVDETLHEIPSSRNLINWLELTSFPEAMNLLPVRPWPVVLLGGRSILPEVIEFVYKKHEIAPEIIKTVDSVIHKIEETRKINRSISP